MGTTTGEAEEARSAGGGRVNRPTVTIQIELTDEEAWQLAQFCKRVTFSDIRNRATSDDETYLMIWALDKVRKQLAEKGYAPR
jgi:hypothetical protein